MDKRIIYTQSNGILAIIIPSPRWDGTIEELAQKDVPEGKSYKIVDINEIPTDRIFRNAWEEGTTSSVKINMMKARDIHMDKIRSARDKKLIELDKRKYGSEFDTERQTLRDIPQTVDLAVANNPDELKTLWPIELPTN